MGFKTKKVGFKRSIEGINPIPSMDNQTLAEARQGEVNDTNIRGHESGRVKSRVDRYGLSCLIPVLHRGMRQRAVVLTEKWFKTTHSFQFPNIELTLTPIYFSAITGL